ncbi:MAG: recombinase family protein [Terriglobia bacterium]
MKIVPRRARSPERLALLQVVLEALDFTTTTGKLLFQIISAFAEFERDCIRERVRAGLRNAKAKGKRIGRPPRLLDYSKIMHLRRDGHFWREVGQRLGVGATTARRRLFESRKNPAAASGS